MPDRSRWRTPPHIGDFIAAELAAARQADEPWNHLERAHIASQAWAWPHTRVHAVMLTTALRQRNRHETIGQLVRLAVASPGSLTGRYPTGNTGRSTMALTRTAPVPDELADLLDAATTAPVAGPVDGHGSPHQSTWPTHGR